MKKIVYHCTQEMLRASHGDAVAALNPDGLMAIVHPVINTYPRRENITEEQALDRAKKKLPFGVSFAVVDEADIPKDRSVRDCLRISDGKIIVKNAQPPQDKQ